MSAFLVPKDISDQKIILAFLTEHFPSAAHRLQSDPFASFMYIKRRLSEKDLELISHINLPCIHLLSETNRFYPIPSAAPLIGFTDIDNVGKAGIELSYNRQLTGSPTTICLEKDARSGYYYFDKQLTLQGIQSEPVHLTIDGDLQFLVDQELAIAREQFNATSAAVLILDPSTGDILALSSAPYSLPTDPHFAIEHARQLAVTDQYEFGSVMKVFAALAALEEKVVFPDELIDCKNSRKCTLNGRPITTWSPHGIIPFSDVIAFSNNIGIAQVALRIGTKLYDHYCKLGFGKKIGLCIPAEASGFIQSPDKWSAQSLISLSYGYELAATLIQVAQAFTVIAHNGKLVRPRISLSEPITISEEPLYSKQSIDTMRDILRKTTKHGTGWRAQLKGFDVLTKTGSANTVVNGQYDHDKNIYSAAALLQKGEYKRIIVTFVKEADTPNAFASTIAMPLVRNIMQKMVIHERVI